MRVHAMAYLTMFLIASAAAAGVTVSKPTSIWRPKAKTTWQWQLDGEDFTGILKQRPDMVDVDMDSVELLLTQVVKLGMKRSDFKLICYFSLGTYEPDRVVYDKARGIDWKVIKKIPNMFAGAYAPPFADELWFNLGDPAAYAASKEVTRLRTLDAYNKGCDGVEYDNTAAYVAYPKKVKLADQLRFNLETMDHAHSLNLSVGLKNSAELLTMKFADGRPVASTYDWFLNEECFTFDECSLYDVLPSTAAVFGVEYCDSIKQFGSGIKNLKPECFCPLALANPRLSWLYKAVDLTAPGITCTTFCAVPKNNCTAPAKNNVKLCGVSKPASLCPKYSIKAYN